MDNFSLFEELGIELPKIETKKATKATKAPAKKGAKKPTEKQEEKLVFPLTVLTGVCPATVLTKEQAGDADTLEKVAELICKQTGVPRSITIAKRFSNNKIAVVLDRGKVQAKGEFDIAPTSVVVIGESKIALHELEGKRTAMELNDYIAKQSGEMVPYQFIADSTALYAVVGDNVAVGIVSLPVKVKSPLGDMVLGVEDFDLTDGDEDEVEIEDIEEKVFGSASHQELEPILCLSRAPKLTEENTLYVVLKALTRDIPKGATADKETTYPTNAVISLIFNKIPLTPEMFGGKERASEKEIISLLQTDYPEFTEQRTKLTYDKDGNFIFPSLKSSSKGAVMYGSREECVEAAKKEPIYFLGNYRSDGKEYRYEKTPVSVIEATDDGKTGLFQWKLPKIPKCFLEAIEGLFSYVTVDYETEALVQIFYDTHKKEYFVTIPQQVATKTAVTTEDMSLSTSKVYHVMDIHSHNTMPAFFSHIDDEDEKANRVYGVMGAFGTEKHEMKFRAATGGKFVDVSASEIFAEEWDPDGYFIAVPDGYVLAQELYELWLRKATIN